MSGHSQVDTLNCKYAQAAASPGLPTWRVWSRLAVSLGMFVRVAILYPIVSNSDYMIAAICPQMIRKTLR